MEDVATSRDVLCGWLGKNGMTPSKFYVDAIVKSYNSRAAYYYIDKPSHSLMRILDDYGRKNGMTSIYEEFRGKKLLSVEALAASKYLGVESVCSKFGKITPNTFRFNLFYIGTEDEVNGWELAGIDFDRINSFIAEWLDSRAYDPVYQKQRMITYKTMYMDWFQDPMKVAEFLVLVE